MCLHGDEQRQRIQLLSLVSQSRGGFRNNAGPSGRRCDRDHRHLVGHSIERPSACSGHECRVDLAWRSGACDCAFGPPGTMVTSETLVLVGPSRRWKKPAMFRFGDPCWSRTRNLVEACREQLYRPPSWAMAGAGRQEECEEDGHWTLAVDAAVVMIGHSVVRSGP